MRYFLLVLTFVMTMTCGFAADYNVYKLNNGQTVIIKEIHDNPIVTIDTWIKTGSVNETDKNTGVSHFLEHLFFKGTEKYPTGEFDKILESKGAITNAATSKDYTHYYVTLPSKDFEMALNMHADMLLHPLIPRKELEKERKVVLEEISRSNDNPSTKLYENLNTSIYQTHPYKRKVLGTPGVISTITREEIMDYYNKHYVPQNMVTIIVGDVDSAKAIKQVEGLFTTENGQKFIPTARKAEKQLTKPIEVIDKFNVQSSYLLMAFRGVDSTNKKDAITLDVLATILGDGKTSRLYQNIKEQKRLAYVISAGHATSKDDSLFYVSANYKPEDYDKLKSNILAEINALKTTPISEDEIKKAKSIIERDTYYSRESTSNITSEIGYMAVLYDDIKSYKEYVDNVKKVTAKDLQEAAKKYLDTNKMVISVLNPEAEVDSKKSSSENPEILVSEQKNPPALKPIKTQGTISEYKLSNNADLILNKNMANDIVAIEIYAKGGEFIETKPGEASLMAAAMLKGTKKYSMQQLMTILEENGIKMDVGSSSDAFSISIKATKNELPLIFEVLNEVVNNATFDPQEIEKIKVEKIAAIKRSRDNPMNVAMEEFKSRIWGSYPYANTGKVYEKTFPTINRDDLTKLYQKMFYPENLVISVNGNVEANTLAQNFDKIFKGTTGTKLETSDFRKEFKYLPSQENVKIDKASEAAWLVLGWPTESWGNLKDYATLKVINSLLGTGMSSRMFTTLRDQQGLAYQVGSSYSSNINRGTFLLYIGTNPKNIEIAKKGMLGEIEKLKKEYVSDKELNETKDKILGNYIISQETNMEKAETLGWFEVANHDWRFIDEFPKLIQSVTATDIIGVVNKYFSKPYLYVLVSPKAPAKSQ